MNRHLSLLTLLAIPLAISGCSFDQPIPEEAGFAIEKAKEFELFSLDPFPEKRVDQNNNFRRWSILGSTVIKDQETRNRMIKQFKAAVAEHRGGPKRGFIPRHGIRVVHDGSTHEFVVSFECSQVRWYIDGKPSNAFLISDSARESFDAALREANVRLSEAESN